MPSIFFGTMDLEQPYESTLQALECGIRHIDSAELYKNNSHVGRAISDSKVARSDLCVVSKLKGIPSGSYEDVKARVNAMLSEMGLDYFDVLLIHWPGPDDIDLEGSASAVEQKSSFGYFTSNITSGWTHMLRLKTENLCRDVGVSNFYQPHVEYLLSQFSSSEQRPTMNELQIDILHQETKFVSYMQSKNMRVLAYRSGSFVPVYEMAAGMGDPTFQVLSKLVDEKRDARSIIMAWLVSRGISPIIKSKTRARVEAALNAIDSNMGSSVFDALDAPGSADMVEMCGGLDEYAAAWKRASRVSA